MPNENELLSRARQFDESALTDIYDRFSTDLYRYAMRLLGDSHMAEDCVSETFSRLLRALHQGGGPRTHLRAYLYRIAHNWITDHYRRKSPEPARLDPEEQIQADLDLSATVFTKIEAERVRAAMGDLTADQRQVILLKFLEGWKNDEIAQALGKPVGSVKALQHRGLAALRRLMIREELSK